MQIHELNNFTGTPGSTNYLAIDNGSDTSRISGTDLLAPVNARIDNVVLQNKSESVNLFAGSISKGGGTYSLSESAANFDFLEFVFVFNGATVATTRVRPNAEILVSIPGFNATNSPSEVDITRLSVSINGANFTVAQAYNWAWNGESSANSYTTPAWAWADSLAIEVYGIRYAQLDSTEVTDLRTAHDGTVYPTARAAREADYNALDSEIAEADAQIDAIKNLDPFTPDDWEQGGLQGDDTNRINLLFDTHEGGTANIKSVSGYQYTLRYYDTGMNIVSTEGDWSTDERTLTLTNGFIRIAARKSDNSVLTPSAGSNIAVKLYYGIVNHILDMDDSIEDINNKIDNLANCEPIEAKNWKAGVRETNLSPDRINLLIPTRDGDGITIGLNTGYRYYLQFLDVNKETISTEDTWSTTARTLQASDGYIRIVGAKTTESADISISEGAENFTIKIYYKLLSLNDEINALRFGGSYATDVSFTNNGYIDQTNGNVISYNNWKYTGYIDISKSASKILVNMYRNGTPVLDGAIYNAWYDQNKNYISALTITNADITIPSGAKYIRLSCRSAYDIKVDLYAKGVVDIGESGGGGSVTVTGEYLKFATWNVGIFNDGTHTPTAAQAPQQIAKLLKTIGKMNADVLNTQEFTAYIDSSSTYPTGNMLNFKYPHKATKSISVTGSKLAISNYQVINFNSGSGRSCFSFDITFNDKVITIINAHLSIELSPTYRQDDIAQLISYMNTKEYVILSGDFNVSSDAEFNPFKAAGYTLCNGGDFGWFDTWPVFANMWDGFSTDWPTYHLDNIIVSSNIIPQYVEAVESAISDHAPLYAELKIN